MLQMQIIEIIIFNNALQISASNIFKNFFKYYMIEKFPLSKMGK